MICLCLNGETRHEWTRQLERNREWIGMVEMRVDLLRPAERTPTALGAWWEQHGGGLDAILTIRRSRDLGRWEGDEAQRLFLFTRLIPAVMPRYIDIELDRQGNPGWDQLALMFRAQDGTVVRSHHEVHGMPEDPAEYMARLAADAQEIPKLAVPCESTEELIRLLEAVRSFRRRMNRRNGIWIGMGEYGRPSRLLPARVGSLWTYAFDDEGAAAAPGQVPVRDLSRLYRINEAQPDWPVFSVVGSPIAHSASPRYHNERFSSDGVNAVYIPIHLDRFEQFSTLADLLGIRGASVTVPHKAAALDFADESDEETRRIGAANTLLREGSADAPRWVASNSDVAGFLAALVPQAPPAVQVAPAPQGPPPSPTALSTHQESPVAVVIGAGGAARAVVAGLLRIGYRPVLFNRTVERAEALAADFGLPSEDARSLEGGAGITKFVAVQGAPPKLIIQTTSVGLDADDDPVRAYRFAGSELAYDLIYEPAETPFLSRAREAGCTTINGAAMFDAQAAEQYRRFLELLSR